MGACEFSNTIVIKGTSREAYREAVEEMRDYNGHQEGYSGDIQTSHGFGVSYGSPRFGTKAFYEWRDKKLERMDKGDCLCVEIKSPSTIKKLKSSYGMKGKKGVKAYYFFGLGRC